MSLDDEVKLVFSREFQAELAERTAECDRLAAAIQAQQEALAKEQSKHREAAAHADQLASELVGGVRWRAIARVAIEALGLPTLRADNERLRNELTEIEAMTRPDKERVDAAILEVARKEGKL